MKRINTQKGITLIALIISIIVLLILAVISINAVQGDGIISHAKNARNEYEIATEKEQIQLAVTSSRELPNMDINTETLEEQLNKIQNIEIVKGTNKWTVTGTKTGMVYEIDIETATITSELASNVKVDEAPGTLEEVGTNTYEINSIEDLVALAYNVNTGTNTYSGATVKLGRNLYFNGSFNSYTSTEDYIYVAKEGYRPIGEGESGTTLKSYLYGETVSQGFIPIGCSSNSTFEGTFLGQNYYLDGLYINSNYDAGFFGVNNSKIIIQDLGIKSGNITCGSGNAGGLIASCYSGATTTVIQNCYYDGNITGKGYTGGIVGNLYTPTGGGEIRNCSVSGNIQSESSYDIGGVVGCLYAYVPIYTCTNNANVTSIEGKDCIGGIVGYTGQGAVVQECTNNGNISGGQDIGGICGHVSTSMWIFACMNNGNVSGTTNIGGIVGSTYGGLSSDSNYGNVKITTKSGGGYIGGIAGWSNGLIASCTNYGTEVTGRRLYRRNTWKVFFTVVV